MNTLNGSQINIIHGIDQKIFEIRAIIDRFLTVLRFDSMRNMLFILKSDSNANTRTVEHTFQAVSSTPINTNRTPRKAANENKDIVENNKNLLIAVLCSVVMFTFLCIALFI